jgi:uncharacterized SAM-binding protein YcdF (DUF218 family)
VLEILKQVGGPSFIVFVAFSLFLGVVFLYVWPRSRRLAKHWVLWLSGVYVVLGLPVVANSIARALPAVPVHDAGGAHTLIVLDGDNRRGRLAETVRYLRTHKPAAFWVLGEEWLIEALIREGYPRRTFGQEQESRTTREQMQWVQRFAAARPGVRVAVLASRVQMPRVAALAQTLNLDVTLVASPLDVEPATTGWRRFVPAYSALRESRDAIYEHAALIYYQRKGWITR